MGVWISKIGSSEVQSLGLRVGFVKDGHKDCKGLKGWDSSTKISLSH